MDDLISRQAAINGKILIQRANGVEIYSDEAVPVEYLKRLPPAEPKHGKWIPCTKKGIPLTEYGRMRGEKWYGYKCSKCNFIYKGNALIECNFCQKCGIDMRMDG